MDGVSESQPDPQSGQPAEAQPVETRMISEIDSLRALADPTRLAILTTLMESREELPVMSAKELAARLDQPQTKLYRHLRQLESAGLIRVAATRMVSGILEQRYQACQRDLEFGSGFLREHADESEAVMDAMLSNFRDGYIAAFRDKRLAPDAVPESEAYRRPTLFVADMKVSAAAAAQIRSAVQELMSRLTELNVEDPHGVVVNTLVGYYRDPEPEDRDADTPQA
jgi:DNA-binding transcriptional ArsR family regulator